MWQDKLSQLAQRYPEAIKLHPGASWAQIEQLEVHLGVNPAEFAPDWVEFLRYTDGAVLLEYTFLRANQRRRRDDFMGIAENNENIWKTMPNPWAEKNFVAFLTDPHSVHVGFVRDQNNIRCIGFLFEMDEVVALPIASSFTAFLNMFLEDIEATLKFWDSQNGTEKVPRYITTYDWPFELAHLCRRDSKLNEMLKNGSLNDVFIDESWEYFNIVQEAIQ